MYRNTHSMPMVAKKKKNTFIRQGMYRRKEPHPFAYLSERTTFWVAVLSLFAFVTGNMLGQHGWHVFWRSVIGGYDDSLLVYDRTVTPMKQVVDLEKWSRLYSGDSRVHTFRQAPSDVLVDMPA